MLLAGCSFCYSQANNNFVLVPAGKYTIGKKDTSLTLCVRCK